MDQQDIYRADKKFYNDQGIHFGSRIVLNGGYIYFVVGERGGRMQAQDVTRPNGKSSACSTTDACRRTIRS